MNIEIINIGDELLIGQVLNTNASWMAQELNLSGFNVHRISVIPDVREDIMEALSVAETRSDIILISGGLGPTRDDITKHALCEYFNTELIFHEESYANIERIFAARGMMVSDLNRLQAMLPANCKPLLNTEGTAPGMLFDKNRKLFVSLPGVPFEMKMLMNVHVIPELLKRYNVPEIFHRCINTTGIGESALADMIKEWELSLPSHIKLAYLPSPGTVKLRLSGKGDDRVKLKNEISSCEKKLLELISEFVFGYDSETLEEVLGKTLMNKGLNVCTAESCTGGYIAHRITSVPGSSGYFKGSVIAYANDIKNIVLEIPYPVIEKHGAVSCEVVTLMAENIRRKFRCDVSVAVSGVAGPEGGTSEKPIGTVWIAVSTNKGTRAHHYVFGNNRERNIISSATAAMHLILKEISL